MFETMITNPTILQARRESDGSLSALARITARPNYLSWVDYSIADLNGLIEINVTEPIGNDYVSINYFVK